MDVGSLLEPRHTISHCQISGCN